MSNLNGSASSRLRQPTTVVRRATLATCRTRPQTALSNAPLKSNAPKPSSKTAAAPTKRTNTAQKSLKRQISNSENSMPAAKVQKNENNHARTTATKNASSKRRAAWDYKGRLEDMEQYISSVNQKLLTTNERLIVVETNNNQLEGNVLVKENEKQQECARGRGLETRLESLIQEKTATEQKYKEEFDFLHEEKDRFEREKEELTFDLEIAQKENKTLKQKVSLMATESLALTTELQAVKAAFTKTHEENRQRANFIQTLETTVASHIETIERCEEKLREEESLRRQLHNTIQELKGNIRVYCRVRPSLPAENDLVLSNIDYQTDKNIVFSQQSGTETISGGKRSPAKFPFVFDKVFAPNSSQSLVFDEVSQLIQSVLDGYNVCIFAYGQTGSGKTFTMEGDLNEKEAWGMIPRALAQVFHTSENLRSKGWQYEMEASFLEIYNEAIRDLLGSGDTNVKHEIKLVGGTTCGKQVANDVVVTNLQSVAVTSSDQVSSLLRKACDNRAVAATNCNERSSRSHSVFRLKMTGVNHVTEERCKGTLNLVDLAGSERLNQSGSTGARLKETQNINRSLSNLGIVIAALANKEQHIPFRNSKLTYLLQNSLGGNSKSLMFVNISPREDSFQETLSSLRFATQKSISKRKKRTSRYRKIKVLNMYFQNDVQDLLKDSGRRHFRVCSTAQTQGPAGVYFQLDVT